MSESYKGDFDASEELLRSGELSRGLVDLQRSDEVRRLNLTHAEINLLEKVDSMSHENFAQAFNRIFNNPEFYAKFDSIYRHILSSQADAHVSHSTLKRFILSLIRGTAEQLTNVKILLGKSFSPRIQGNLQDIQQAAFLPPRMFTTYKLIREVQETILNMQALNTEMQLASISGNVQLVEQISRQIGSMNARYENNPRFFDTTEQKIRLRSREVKFFEQLSSLISLLFTLTDGRITSTSELNRRSTTGDMTGLLFRRSRFDYEEYLQSLARSNNPADLRPPIYPGLMSGRGRNDLIEDMLTKYKSKYTAVSLILSVEDVGFRSIFSPYDITVGGIMASESRAIRTHIDKTITDYNLTERELTEAINVMQNEYKGFIFEKNPTYIKDSKARDTSSKMIYYPDADLSREEGNLFANSILNLKDALLFEAMLKLLKSTLGGPTAVGNDEIVEAHVLGQLTVADIDTVILNETHIHEQSLNVRTLWKLITDHINNPPTQLQPFQLALLGKLAETIKELAASGKIVIRE